VRISDSDKNGTRLILREGVRVIWLKRLSFSEVDHQKNSYWLCCAKWRHPGIFNVMMGSGDCGRPLAVAIQISSARLTGLLSICWVRA
jgi:hypothetical protein